MAVKVVALDIVVVVLPVLGTSVVGRVDVDGVDLALVGVGEGLEDVEVLAVDDGGWALPVVAVEGSVVVSG